METFPNFLKLELSHLHQKLHKNADPIFPSEFKTDKLFFCFIGLKNPGWALIDIQSFSALIQRFLRFQRCSELNQSTLILTSLVTTDSVMNISEHLWFSAEHYWQAANRQRPWKKPTKSVFLSILMLKRREIENFRITFNGLFWKILKMWFFRNRYFLLIPSQKTSY